MKIQRNHLVWILIAIGPILLFGPMLVRGEVMRGKYRNSFEEPEPFVPGEITKVSFEIPDLAHKFKAGHKLMIQVQSWRSFLRASKRKQGCG